ncbi:hypothetical protein BC830DRAFT_270306 [Chytriomyces sp. MP71]|nr:hypothetical protein BC830DRAFT_270306 [Chytriomyces sp. MP71]
MHLWSSVALLAGFSHAADVPCVPPEERDDYFDYSRAPSSPYKGPLTNLGGDVLDHIQVFLVFYGNAKFQAQLAKFYSGIVTSGYFDWLSEYGVYSGTFEGSFKANVTQSDSDPKNVANAVIAKYNLTNRLTSNSYLAIHYGPEYNKQRGNCESYCAYHDQMISKTGQRLTIGMIPDCSTTCYDANAYNSMTCVASHELVETATDPHMNAWLGASNGEIGDLCYNQCGKLKDRNGNTHVVQYLWSNTASKKNKGNGCIITTTKSGGKTTANANTKTKRGVPNSKTTSLPNME